MQDGSPPRATESHRPDRRRESPRADEAGNKRIFRQQRIWQRLSIDSRHAQASQKDLPYRIFKVELEDMENGDRGEGLYYMEKENYVQ